MLRLGQGCGVMGVGQNKGGIVVTMRYNGHPLAFVGSHLAAHEARIHKGPPLCVDS